jgi:hypothetical protein
MKPVLAGGAIIALPRVVAGSVVALSTGEIAVVVLIGVHTLPFKEWDTWPPGISTPVNEFVKPTPVATHVATPEASTPHVTSVPEVENTPAPVAAAQFAPSYE